jgi:hypothetical protein
LERKRERLIMTNTMIVRVEEMKRLAAELELGGTWEDHAGYVINDELSAFIYENL